MFVYTIESIRMEVVQWLTQYHCYVIVAKMASRSVPFSFKQPRKVEDLFVHLVLFNSAVARKAFQHLAVHVSLLDVVG